MKKTSMVLAVLLVVIMLFAACAPATAGQTTGATEEEAGAEEVADSKKLGVSLYCKVDEWTILVADEFEKQGKERGYEMIIQDANSTPETQKQQLENFATQQCDMILFDCVDPEGAGTTLDELKARDIPIIGYDEPPVWDDLVSFISWDNYQTGVDMGKYVREYIDENYDGVGNIVTLGLAQSLFCTKREEGFIEGLDLDSADGKIRIIAEQESEHHEEKSMNIITNIKEDFNVVFAVTDPGAFGACAALEQLERDPKEVAVFSCGGYGEKTFTYTRDNPYFQGVVVVPPDSLITKVMDTVDAYFAGEEYNKQEYCETFIADKENLSELVPGF